MKRITAILLAVLMMFSLVACGGDDTVSGTDTTNLTVGQTLCAQFESLLASNPDMTAQELADAIITNEIIPFFGGTVPVEEGYLSGFDNAEVKGFEEGVMFAPMMGTIPFVGYIFTLAEDADVEAFKQFLSDNANLRWNICTEAEEMIVENVGNKVFFIMCPSMFEIETPSGADMAV